MAEFYKAVDDLGQFIAYQASKKDSLIHEQELFENPLANKMQNYFTSYIYSTNEPREQQRVLSLMLIIFKMGSHKELIIDILNSYSEEERQSRMSSDQNQASQKKLVSYNEKMSRSVQISKLNQILNEVAAKCGFVICSYDQLSVGYNKKTCDSESLLKLEEFIFLNKKKFSQSKNNYQRMNMLLS